MTMRPSIKTSLRSVALIAAALSTSVASAAESDEEAWAMINQRIYTFIKGRDQDFDKKYLLQLPSVPVYANWLEKGALYSLYGVADSVPNWGPTWFPTTRTVSRAYEEFVHSVKLPKETPEQTALENAYVTTLEAYNTEKTDLESLWDTFNADQQKNKPKNTWKSRDAFLQDKKGRRTILHGRMLNAFTAYYNSLSAGQQVYAKWVRQTVEADPIDVRLPVNPEDINGDESDPTIWKPESRLPFTFDVSAMKNLIEAGKEQEKKGGLAETWEFKAGKEKRYEERNKWGATAKYGAFFRAKGGSESISIDFNKDNTYLKYGFHAIRLIPVRPTTNWYIADTIEKFACGPFKPPGEGGSIPKPSDFWGEKGRLSVVPVAVVAAYKPVLEAKLTKEQFAFFERRSGGSGRIGIGPFAVGGGGSSFKQSIDKNNAEGVVTLKTTSPEPAIIAVLFEKLPRTVSCPP